MNKDFINYISPSTPLENMDVLERYALWILNEVPLIGYVPFNKAVWKIEDVTSLVIHRNPPFQTQLFIAQPNTIVPEHIHPNVDSIEVYVGGDLHFSHSGKYVFDKETVSENKEHPFGIALTRNAIVRVKPNDIHGGYSGSSGAAFLSIQHWLNGVTPHCVAADYEGVVMGPDHLNKVICGNAVLSNKPLTQKDAAHLC